MNSLHHPPMPSSPEPRHGGTFSGAFPVDRLSWQSIANSVFLVLMAWGIILSASASASQDVPAVILDTDLSADVDDVGAVAVLHTLASKGEVRILATMISSADPWSAPCLRALNSWHGRPDIPIGVAKAAPVPGDASKYTRALAEQYAGGVTTAEAPQDAVTLYRRILAAAADNSVTIITVGYLTNLSNLLQSTPDSSGSLGGTQLLQTKVQRLVVMGGQFPRGREWNLYQDPSASRHVVTHWPTSLTFCGLELGNDIMTGAGLSKLATDHPVRQAYALYNGLTNRQSWDQMTVLYAIRGQEKAAAAKWFQRQCGRIELTPDGSNTWQDGADCTMGHVTRKFPAPVLAAQVESLMAGH